MCGIAGILCPPRDGHPLHGSLPSELERLTAALGHRGPDARGTHVDGGVGLAHTRLSVIDLSEAGAQPMVSPDGRYVLVYNGEVYNLARLRTALEERGERFAGRSDTEVVLRLLVREGQEALSRIDGMFALALLDTRGGEVLLARDRMGQKPLYYAPVDGGGWAFASELLPLLGVPGVDRRVDPEGLSHMFTFGLVPAPFTLRRGVRQLRPGTLAWLRAGREEHVGRWAAEPGPLEPLHRGGEEELSRRLEEILSGCVAEHLVADVPVGVLLSGGVDSSAVAALAARHTGRLETFSIVHRDPAYDERDAARAVAEVIGSEHHEVELSEAPLSEEELDTLIDRHGDPYAESSSLNMLRLSRDVRRHVTVAISGDGADEVFAGYPRFALLRLVSGLAHVPRPLLIGSRALLAPLPGLRSRQVARAFQWAAMARERRAVAVATKFWPEELPGLLRPEFLPEGGPGVLDALLRERGANLERDPVASAHWLEQRLILPDYMLTKVDRMSMAASLEVRAPFLADGVLDFAARLPFAMKNRGLTGKRILRTVARRLVPPWVVDRPKKGFALPLEQHGGKVFEDATRFALESRESPLQVLCRPEGLKAITRSLYATGEGRRDPEDSPFRRVHRRWILALLARTLLRHGGLD